ncbi:MAG: DEAD/DEAH box helicase [Oceanospirillaceae bacterium]|nr:DEAD/DEAH box helicase [Oceanospirillaceae bacterium]
MSKLTLRPYQRDAVAATVSYFRRHSSNALIVLPTGAGKSLVIAELAAIANRRVLVLAHVKELVEQNHQKFRLYDLDSSVFSAGLKQKDSKAKVVFASIQSVVRNLKHFKEQYSLVIIDECHRISEHSDSQYAKVIALLKSHNKQLKVLGLTATPYRLGIGWIYQYHYHGYARNDANAPFRDCIYELPLSYMIKHKYLTPPKVYDAAIAQYNFSQLPGYETDSCSTAALNTLLIANQRVTQSIIEQVIELSRTRQGVMIFAATVKHAEEVFSYLPSEQSAIITGATDNAERDLLISAFKARKLKYLVNVSVLTTGFDAPHVDVIALLRPTQSVSLFQQIVGRGLRLSPDKKDCLILDYTGSKFNIFHPEVGASKPDPDSEPVQVFCPQCNFANIFWGKTDAQGEIIEHFGRRCQGLNTAETDIHNDTSVDPRCQFRFRYKNCPQCFSENDIAARQCHHCHQALVDPDDQLKKALQLKDAKVIRCAGISFSEHKNTLKITYHDEQGETLTEYFNLNNPGQRAVFDRLFSRRLANQKAGTKSHLLTDVIAGVTHYPTPDFVIARKHGHYWQVADRIFDYQGKFRRANQL